MPVPALRVTFVGELGWELYCPTEYGAGLWRHALGGGSRASASSPPATSAIDSLRLEKGYRVWGSDITPGRDPYQAGLGFCVSSTRSGFVGAERCRGSTGAGRDHARCLVPTIRAPSRWATSRCRSKATSSGASRAAASATRSGSSIAYAYLPADAAGGAAVEVDIFGRWVPGEVAREPLFDPQGERVRS